MRAVISVAALSECESLSKWSVLSPGTKQITHTQLTYPPKMRIL